MIRPTQEKKTKAIFFWKGRKFKKSDDRFVVYVFPGQKNEFIHGNNFNNFFLFIYFFLNELFAGTTLFFWLSFNRFFGLLLSFSPPRRSSYTQELAHMIYSIDLTCNILRHLSLHHTFFDWLFLPVCHIPFGADLLICQDEKHLTWTKPWNDFLFVFYLIFNYSVLITTIFLFWEKIRMRKPTIWSDSDLGEKRKRFHNTHTAPTYTRQLQMRREFSRGPYRIIQFYISLSIYLYIFFILSLRLCGQINVI